MSANLIVDIGGTTQALWSFPAAQTAAGGIAIASGLVNGLSGVIIGQTVDLGYSDTYCNVVLAGTAVLASGPLSVQIQTSNSTVSGNFGDPTSGLAVLPPNVYSGGFITVNSGSTGGVFDPIASGNKYVQSGWLAFVGFQRTGRFARLNHSSGFYIGELTAGFVSQLRTTTSGAGSTQSPGSGAVNV